MKLVLGKKSEFQTDLEKSALKPRAQGGESLVPQNKKGSMIPGRDAIRCFPKAAVG